MPNCETCDNEDTCINCLGANRDGARCECMTGYQEDPVSENCITQPACVPKCKACDSERDNCTECQGLYRNEALIPSCPCKIGYYDDGINKDC